MSDKKKHHTFRVQMPVREVMKRLQNYYGRFNIRVHTLGLTSYDLNFEDTRLSLREDDTSKETIVFLEYEDRVEVIVERLLYLLKGYNDRPSNFERLARGRKKLELDINPSEFIKQLENLTHPTGRLTLRRTPDYHVLKQHPSQFRPNKSEVIIYQGDTPEKTIALVKTYPMTGLDASANCLGLFFLFWLMPTIFLLFLIWHIPVLIYVLSLIIFVINLGIHFRWANKVQRNIKEFDEWLLASLQAIPQTIKTDTHDDVEAVQPDVMHTPDENMRRANE